MSEMQKIRSIRNVAGIARRDFLKTEAAASALGISGLANSASPEETPSKLAISVAGYDYDRVRAIMDGQVSIDGTDINFEVEDIYAVSTQAFGPEKKYDITEIGLLPFVRQYVNKDFRAYTLIPVFISRTFRHRNIYVHVNSGIQKPEDLRGKRVGTPGYGFSAHTWIRVIKGSDSLIFSN